MKKLYEAKDRNGDITFVFKNGDKDLEIPVP
jgi:hypothetical protein